MKKIQYMLDMTYTNDQVLKIFGILLKVVVGEMQTLKKKRKKFSPKDFVIWPMRTSKVTHLHKILMVSDSTRGETVLDSIDRQFMQEVEKDNFKVVREEVVK